MSRSIGGDDEFDDLSWIDKKETVTQENEKNEENDSAESAVDDFSSKDSQSESSIANFNIETLESEENDSKRSLHRSHDNEFSSTTTSTHTKGHGFEIYIHILEPSEREEILDALSQLPSHVTGFESHEFKAAFENHDLIKIAFLSLYEAVLIQVKLNKYNVRIQVLEKI